MKKQPHKNRRSFDLSDVDQQSAIWRFTAGMTHVKDDHLHIMRGHLLIEELLRELINSKINKPEALTEARLTSHHVSCIAEAFYWRPGSDWLWEGIKRLNIIRNGLSHRPTFKDYDGHVDAFLRLVEAYDSDPVILDIKELSPDGRLFRAMSHIYCCLSQYLSEKTRDA